MDDFPACYPEDTIALLEGSEIKEYIEERVKNYYKDYEYIAQYVPDIKKFDFNDFRYANLMSSSRTFDLDMDGVSTRCMVPYADMMNHKNPMENKWFYDSKTKCFTVEALQNIPFGEPVYYSYGEKSTASLFLNYGFVLHPHDKDDKQITLVAKAPEDDFHGLLKR